MGLHAYIGVALAVAMALNALNISKPLRLLLVTIAAFFVGWKSGHDLPESEALVREALCGFAENINIADRRCEAKVASNTEAAAVAADDVAFSD